MSVKTVTTLEELERLYYNGAMTWEGLDERDFEVALSECSKTPENDGWHISGKTMNDLCNLTGTNMYPADLTIFAIINYKGFAIKFGARWMTDIIDNNAYREHYHPFKNI